MNTNLHRQLAHSQNFIRQPKLVNELLDLTNIGSHDLVVEIGPGKGTISHVLLNRAGRVIAVERDTGFEEALLPLTNRDQLQLVFEDFLEWPLPSGDYKVFSNIPFNFTADIVRKLTTSQNPPTDIYLIMQEQAAYRFAGAPHHSNSLISILIGLDFSVQVLHKISRANFEPQPSVDAALVHFDRYADSQMPKSLIPNEERQAFRDFVVYGYSQWAPTVLDAFRQVFTKRQRSVIAKSQKLKDLAPTDLVVEQWIGLYKTFRKHVDEQKQSIVLGSEARLNEEQRHLHKHHRTRL